MPKCIHIFWSIISVCLVSAAVLKFLDTPDREVSQKPLEQLILDCTAEGPTHINFTWYKVLT